MPIFTFKCDTCGCERDVVCKVAEREVLVEECNALLLDEDDNDYGDDDYAVCHGRMRWSGRVEGGQATRANGSYKFAVIDQNGKRHVSPAAASRAAKGGLR